MKIVTYKISGLGEYSKYKLECQYITDSDETPHIALLMNHVDYHTILYGDWHNYSISDIEFSDIQQKDLADFINTEFEPVKFI